MSIEVKKTASEYYPKLWSKKRLLALVAADKLTPEEYKEVTGEDYIEGDE